MWRQRVSNGAFADWGQLRGGATADGRELALALPLVSLPDARRVSSAMWQHLTSYRRIQRLFPTLLLWRTSASAPTCVSDCWTIIIVLFECP